MRARLQMLIDYTGLSIREAAELCNCSHEALSRKLAGKERYDVRPAEIERLQALADAQDRAVEAMEDQIAAIKRDAGTGDDQPEVVLLAYRNNMDMLADNGFPFASAHRRVLSRLQQAHRGLVHIVMFDADEYDLWRGDAPDSSELRADWAALQPRIKFSFKVGREGPLDTKHEQAIGWAVWGTGPVPTGKISGGKEKLK